SCRRRHTISKRDWSSDVFSSDLFLRDSTSGNSASRKKSLPVIVGGTLLVLVAGYFGIDLSSSGSGDSGSTNTEVSADSDTCAMRSEERRVGTECSSECSRYYLYR